MVDPEVEVLLLQTVSLPADLDMDILVQHNRVTRVVTRDRQGVMRVPEGVAPDKGVAMSSAMVLQAKADMAATG
jgi:hypothetical protein